MERMTSAPALAPAPARTSDGLAIKRMAAAIAALRDAGELTPRQAESLAGFLSLDRLTGGKLKRPRTTVWRYRVLARELGLVDDRGEWQV